MRRLSLCLLAILLAAPAWAAEPAPRFVDVTADSGLRIVKDSKPHAVAVEDFDRDGWPDIIIATFDAPHIQYFRNLRDLKFKDVTKGSGLEAFKGSGSGVAVGDFDGDGWLDIYICSLRGGESRLFQGKEGGRFVDVSAKSGTLLKSPSRSCAWSDIDGDGRLDLYVTNPEGANTLFRNNGDGTFTNIARQAGVELADRHSLGCAFGDVDGDGLDDLFVTNYHSQVSALFRNLGKGKFRDVTAASGLDRRASAVGCVFGDVFNRGRLDLYVSTDSWLAGANYTEKQLRDMKHTVEPNVLYVNDGKGVFKPLAEPLFDYRSLSHDALLEDLDHDGWPDIYVGVDAESGNQWATSKGGNPLWTRPDGKTWRERSKDWGIRHEANCVCIAAADFDNDGDLDLLLVNFYSNVVLYRNDTNDRNWLRIKVAGKKSNRDGIGARVTLTGVDGTKYFRHIQSGCGYCRCSPLEAHFGLGRKPAESYRVEVCYPATKEREVFAEVKPGRVVTVREGAGIKKR